MARFDKTGAEVKPMGYSLDSNDNVERKIIKIVAGKDYGSDPIGGDMFRMIPSGDVVDGAERARRLAK